MLLITEVQKMFSKKKNTQDATTSLFDWQIEKKLFLNILITRERRIPSTFKKNTKAFYIRS